MVLHHDADAADSLEGLRPGQLFQQAGQPAAFHLAPADIVLEREHGSDVLQGDGSFRHRDADATVIGDGKIHRHLEFFAAAFAQDVREEIAQRNIRDRPGIQHLAGAVPHHFLQVGHLGLDFRESQGNL